MKTTEGDLMHLKKTMLCPAEVLTLSSYPYQSYQVQNSWCERREAEDYLFYTARKWSSSTASLNKQWMPNSFSRLRQPRLSASSLDLRSRALMEPPKSILKKSVSADAAKISEIKTNFLNDMQSLSLDKTNGTSDTSSTSSSPPQSPSKNVTFADAHRLVEIRNFIPSNDSLDLWSDFGQGGVVMDTRCDQRDEKGIKLASKPKLKSLKLCFQEPASLPEFNERFKHRCVALEKCATRDRIVAGVILVKNIEYYKQVIIRYTTDSWKTTNDMEATYLPNSNDRETDRFTMSLTVPKGKKELEFAICYKTSTSEYWDNNYNKNYKIESIL